MALNMKKTFGVNRDKATAGVWVDLGMGARIRVARLNTPQYRSHLLKLTRPHMRAMRSGTIDAELLEKLTVQAIAEKILLGWEGLEIDGPIPYSVENAIRLLTEYPDFAEEVTNAANQIDLFRDEEDTAAAGNSEKPSDGN